MSTLIVYYSYTNNNRILATHLQQQLDADLTEVIPKRKRVKLSILFDLLFKRRPKIQPIKEQWSSYDQILFIAPVWDMQIAHPMKTLLDQLKDENLPRFSFATLCSGRQGQQKSLEQQLQQHLGKPAEQVFQLEINELLPPEQKGKVQYTSTYRIDAQNIHAFDDQLTQLIESITSTDKHQKHADA